MDERDMFYKLTRGAHFVKKRKGSKITANPKVEIQDKIIQEIAVENVKETSKQRDKETLCILNYGEPIQETVKKQKTTNSKPKKPNSDEEAVNAVRNVNKIKVIGKNVPPPVQGFDELQQKYSIQPKSLDLLGQCGYSLPTPIQMQALPIMLEGRSLMACAPTGSGKTVAFLAPIIWNLKGPQKKGFRALILCPTRELAKQTLKETVRLTETTGLRSHVLSKSAQIEQKFGPNSNKKFDILISTPNRIRNLLSQETKMLDLTNIEWVVIDEADKLMEEGQHSFKEQLDEVLSACTNPNKRVALFSATSTVPVTKWALKNLKNLIRVTIGQENSATDLVDQEFCFVGSEAGKLIAFKNLVRKGFKPPVLIFVQTKERAEQLYEELIFEGVSVDVIHANRTQSQRDNVVRAFREGKLWVLICTELMGRGIDFKGVNLVINFDMPPSDVSYIHRIGRTGRAGRPGKAITYFTCDDSTNLRSIANVIKNSGGTVPDFMFSLKKLKKSDKKQLEKKAPKRETISTVPQWMRKDLNLKKIKKKYRHYKSASNELNGIGTNQSSTTLKRKLDPESSGSNNRGNSIKKKKVQEKRPNIQKINKQLNKSKTKKETNGTNRNEM